MGTRHIAALGLIALIAACSDEPGPLDTGPADTGVDGASPDAEVPADLGPTEDVGPADLGSNDGGDAGAPVLPEQVSVVVTLDGNPVAGARVSHGGTGQFEETDAEGRAEVDLRSAVLGPDTTLTAAHPDARTTAAFVLPGHTGDLTIALESFPTEDNPAYRFADPGEPDRRGTTNQCAHCHVSLNQAWYGSAHRKSASNPTVLDVYTGNASHLTSAAACAERGGVWRPSTEPGTGQSILQCQVGGGALQTLNPGCEPPCEGPELGECAACHAPGIDGSSVGRGLLEARGRSHDFGVHCDVCHRVAEVTVQGGPGVAGRLRLLRPTDQAFGLNEDGWRPLTFGPSWDSPNPKMGSVPRPHFRTEALCSGCHQYEQPSAEDLERWPGGRLPVHTTLEEWASGPYAPQVSCQACHMPPVPEAMNGADLQLFGAASAGIAGGWPRAPGSVRSHAFVGPRTEGADLLAMAAHVELAATIEGERFTVRATVVNVGAGHALPTGDPLRQLFLRVEASCGDGALTPTGGDAIGPIGGALAQTSSPTWSQARPGDRVRAQRVGALIDYDGIGSFALGGRFPPAAKGKHSRSYVGEADASNPTFEEASTYFWVRPGTSPEPLAGLPGASFARVTKGADGTLAVPHHAAVDVVRDDRIPPRGRRSSIHHFLATCASPTARAWLVYRPLPFEESQRRGWPSRDQIIAEAQR